jgi:hypothetical protein
MTIMRRLVSLCCLQAKERQRHSVTDFIHRLVDFGFTSCFLSLTGRLFITPVAAVVVSCWIVDVLRSKIV